MNPALPILADCQRILAAHLPPDGISERACISALLGVLDNPEAVALTADLNAVNLDMASPDVRASVAAGVSPTPSVSAAVAEIRAACHEPVAVLMQRLENQKLTIQSLQNELERVRAHELHLIQDRDRLIHKDLAELHKLLNAAIADRNEASEATCRFSERLAQAEGELIASADRGRLLSERLAQIAALSAGN